MLGNHLFKHLFDLFNPPLGRIGILHKILTLAVTAMVFSFGLFGMALAGIQPQLSVGGVPLTPLADSAMDLTLPMCCGTQTWTILKEYAGDPGGNAFGYYTDLGTGNDTTWIFNGASSVGATNSTTIADGTNVGLWLNNSSSYLFSERSLSQGAQLSAYQYFKVYDVSAYKGTGSTYDWDSPTHDYSLTGDYDYLIFIDDDQTTGDFDHNDLVIGIVCNNSPPEASCPANRYFSFPCEGTEECFGSGFTATDVDNNIVSETINIGTLNEGAVCFTPDTAGFYTLYYIVTDACGAADTCICYVTVVFTEQPPVCDLPDDTTYFVCGDTTFNFSVSAMAGENMASCSMLNGDGSYDGSTWTFTTTGPGVYSATFECTNQCGETCGGTVNITVEYNNPPVATCPGNFELFVCDLSDISLAGFSCTDPDDNLISCDVDIGVLTGDEVTFSPVPGLNVITLTATDACGATDECQVEVNIIVNQPPVASCPDDLTVSELCPPAQVCIGPFGATDPDNPIVDESVDFGILSAGEVCFTADTAGVYEINYTVTDSCGEIDECRTLVTVEFTNRQPTATCPGDKTFFVCDLSDITVGGFSCFDPDGNLADCEVDNGTLIGDEVTFTPIEGNNFIVLTATDECGLTDFCQTKVMVTMNQGPQCQLPDDASYFVCGDTTFSFSISATDPDDNLEGCTQTGGVGQFDGATWTFTTSGPGIYSASFECADECGLTCGGTVNITVEYNQPPEASCPGDVAIYAMALEEICVTGFECSDPDGNLISCSVEGVVGTKIGSEICFTPDVWGENTIVLVAEDECGAMAVCSSVVTVIPLLEVPIVKIEKTHGTLQGHFEDISITIEDAHLQMGGFEFLIAYDASALSPIEVYPGQLIEDCGWEYFVYRFGPDGNCGNSCPSGLLRIVAMAEIDDGSNHPDCFGPTDIDPHELARMRFLVTNDRTFQCMYAPIKFFWGDCGDNAISNILGDTLFLDLRILDFEGNMIWDEDNNDLYPETDRLPFVGAANECLLGDKRAPLRLIEFWNGGVDIVCADSIDDVGDINLNGVPNEVADAVMLTNYFVEGLKAFSDHVEASIAASDVNVDGTGLSVADLVYLVRVIIGDANPYSKPVPGGAFNLIGHTDENEMVVEYNASTPIGAALLTFNIEGDLNGSPELGDGATTMDLIYSLNNGELKLLIYNIGTEQIAPGENTLVTIPVNGKITLLEVEAADYYGSVMNTSARIIPGHYALSQNYPNPFNPTTTFSLTLPVETDWKVTIFNIAGQLVRQFSGHDEPGTVNISWDGNDMNGNRVASGIYLYKATAENFTDTRKMVLMK